MAGFLLRQAISCYLVNQCSIDHLRCMGVAKDFGCSSHCIFIASVSRVSGASASSGVRFDTNQKRR